MKKILVGVAMLVAANGAFAANSHQAGKLALGVDTTDSNMITGKYMLSSNMALTGGVLFGMNGGDADGTDLGFRVGMRQYMSNDDFSPFVGGRFGYSNTNDGDSTSMELVAEFGAEYFFSKQFSVEGTAGFGYFRTEESMTIDTGVGTINVDYDANRLGTTRAAIGFNFYF